MSNIDLSIYTLDELKTLQTTIDDEVKARQRKVLGAARKRIRAILSAAGLSVDDLFEKKRLQANKGKKSKENGVVKPKAQYQNPANRSQSWSGRGRQPKWITDGLAGGKHLNDFRIQTALRINN